jgi:hypothetical protein
MSFSPAATIRRLLHPRHELSFSRQVWARLLDGLRNSGRGYSRESGAFLLGVERDGRRRVHDFILYDALDPHSLDTGIVNFDGRYFGELWETCRQRSVSVVADVHTHPAGAGQSDSDRAHPMIAQAGHLAMILPRFAAVPLRRDEIGIYRYLGTRRWAVIDDRAFLHIGF